MSAMGSVVYLAEHRPTGSQVVLKWPVQAKEVAVLQELDRQAPGCTGLPRLLGCGTQMGGHYVVTEMLGVDLTTILERLEGRSVSQRWAVSRVIGRLLLRRLETIHACGYVHGDFAPHNVLFGRRDVDTPYIIDFGCAQRYPGHRPNPGEEGSMEFSSVRSADRGEWCPEDDLEALGWTMVFGVFGEFPWFKTLQELYMTTATLVPQGVDVSEMVETVRKQVQQSKASLIFEGWTSLGPSWSKLAQMPGELDRFMHACQIVAGPSRMPNYPYLHGLLGGRVGLSAEEAELIDRRELRELLGSVLDREPQQPSAPGHDGLQFHRGDAVLVWSFSMDGWIEDGVVLEVALQDRVVAGSEVPGVDQQRLVEGLVTVPRGSVYVSYNNGAGVKWILPWEHEQLRHHCL